MRLIRIISAVEITLLLPVSGIQWLTDLGLEVFFHRFQITMHFSPHWLINMELTMELMKKCNQNTANEIVKLIKAPTQTISESSRVPAPWTSAQLVPTFVLISTVQNHNHKRANNREKPKQTGISFVCKCFCDDVICFHPCSGKANSASTSVCPKKPPQLHNSICT